MHCSMVSFLPELDKPVCHVHVRAQPVCHVHVTAQTRRGYGQSTKVVVTSQLVECLVLGTC